MNDYNFENWTIQTAITIDDISPIIKLVGIKTVDNDHLKLAKYLVEINRLLLEFEKNELSIELLDKQKNIIKQLASYAAAHFLREEKIIEKYSLDYEKEQKKQHSIILDKINKIIDSVEQGSMLVNNEIKSFLFEWLLNHIQNIDYKCFVINKWRTNIIKSKSIDDIYPLYKKCDMETIDNLTENFLKKTIDDFLGLQLKTKIKNKVFENLNSNIENIFTNIKNFMIKFSFPNIKNLTILKDNFLKIIEKHKSETMPDELKYIILKQVFCLVSHDLYGLLNANSFMELILLHANREDEISCFIKKTDYEIIDKDHINFVKLVINANKELKKANHTESHNLLMNITDAMIQYAKDHFKNEENIMDKNNRLPAISEHKNRHKEIIEQLYVLKHYLSNQKVEISTILRSKILNLWINHTNSLDQITFNS